MEPKDLSLSVLYEDNACLVIDKPAGIAVHGAPSIPEDEMTILNGVAYLFESQGLPFSPDSVLVHRLDRETTGCLLIAKNAEAHRELQQQFEDRTVTKTYLAIVAGVPSPREAIIDAPIGRNLTNRTKMSVFRTSKSRDAKTTYRVTDERDGIALLECDLHTGRTHQIRVHLSSINHPILGDPTYHSPASEKLTKEYEIDNLCLHSWKLGFVSPDGGKQLIEAPSPAPFWELFKNQV